MIRATFAIIGARPSEVTCAELDFSIARRLKVVLPERRWVFEELAVNSYWPLHAFAARLELHTCCPRFFQQLQRFRRNLIVRRCLIIGSQAALVLQKLEADG